MLPCTTPGSYLSQSFDYVPKKTGRQSSKRNSQVGRDSMVLALLLNVSLSILGCPKR